MLITCTIMFFSMFIFSRALIKCVHNILKRYLDKFKQTLISCSTTSPSYLLKPLYIVDNALTGIVCVRDWAVPGSIAYRQEYQQFYQLHKKCLHVYNLNIKEHKQ